MLPQGRALFPRTGDSPGQARAGPTQTGSLFSLPQAHGIFGDPPLERPI